MKDVLHKEHMNHNFNNLQSLDLPLATSTCHHGGVTADPLHTLLLEDLPAPILWLVQAVNTRPTILLEAAWALGAGFEPVTPFG